jgi:hypothetical protein
LPHELHKVFPEVSFDAIADWVDERTRELMPDARFYDYIPLLVEKSMRKRLAAAAQGDIAAVP